MIIAIGFNILILLIGLVVLSFFYPFKRLCNVGNFGYAYGLGAGFLALQLFIYSVTGISWDGLYLLLPWGIIIALWVIKYRRQLQPTVIHLPRLSSLEKLLTIFILLLLFFAGIESILRPVSAWDAWASWMLKAKVFYIDGRINSSVFTYIASEYPLLIGLIGTYFYIFSGGINDTLVLLLSYGYYVSLGSIFYANIRKFQSRFLSLFSTFLLLSTQNLIRHGGRYEAGQADLPLGYYIFASALLLLDYLTVFNIRMLMLLQIFLFFTMQVKNEALPYALVVQFILVWFILKKKHYKHLIVIGMNIAAEVGWLLYKVYNHMPSNYLFDATSIHIERIGRIVWAMGMEFFRIDHWNLLWIAFFLSCILYLFQKKHNTITLLLVLFFMQIFSYMSVFLFTPVDPVIHIADTVDRLYIHIAPLALFVTILILKRRKIIL